MTGGTSPGIYVGRKRDSFYDEKKLSPSSFIKSLVFLMIEAV